MVLVLKSVVIRFPVRTIAKSFLQKDKSISDDAVAKINSILTTFVSMVSAKTQSSTKNSIYKLLPKKLAEYAIIKSELNLSIIIKSKTIMLVKETSNRDSATFIVGTVDYLINEMVELSQVVANYDRSKIITLEHIEEFLENKTDFVPLKD
jgi:hypothetical protein